MFDGFNFTELNGTQLATISETIVSVLLSRRQLDFFLRTNDLGDVEDFPADLVLRHLAFEIALESRARGRLGRLLDRLQAEYPDSPYIHALAQRLQALQPSPAPGQDVDRNLQWLITRSGFQSPLLLADRIIGASSQVCRIQYPVAFGVAQGTGFLVGENLVLTAGHVMDGVLNGKAASNQVQLTFGFAESPASRAEVRNVGLAADWCVAHQPHSAADLTADSTNVPAATELDFALLRLAEPVGNERHWVSLKDVPSGAPSPELLTVLQHPRGQVLSLAFGAPVTPATPHRLRYRANTLKGSSGGLVLDEQMRPVALHHAGDPEGPLRPRYNQGIPLNEIALAMEMVRQ
jgi:hypothetical protein